MNKWISVKDRPVPSDGETYLIYRIVGNCGFCELRKGNLVYGNVTHWMPLPEPPEEGDSIMASHEICRDALKTWGPQKQTLKLFEEMSELQDALCKQMDGRDSSSHVAEEIADVLVVLEQMTILHDCKQEVIKIKAQKLERLRRRIEGTEI